MSREFLSRARLLLLVGFGVMFAAYEANAAVVSAPVTTIKRFTGLLSGSGPVYQAPGARLSRDADWVDFICDPRSLNWKIRVEHRGARLLTRYLSDPHICDHVEIMMFYYNPQISFPETGLVDGTAIYIKKIP